MFRLKFERLEHSDSERQNKEKIENKIYSDLLGDGLFTLHKKIKHNGVVEFDDPNRAKTIDELLEG
jgi:hypothetical protein